MAKLQTFLVDSIFTPIFNSDQWYGPDQKILVLMALANNEGSDELPPTRQSLHCSHTKSMDVEEDSDLNIDL